MLIIGRIIEANLVLVFFFCVGVMYACEYMMFVMLWLGSEILIDNCARMHPVLGLMTLFCLC
jgi:hypothetical protein